MFVLQLHLMYVCEWRQVLVHIREYTFSTHRLFVKSERSVPSALPFVYSDCTKNGVSVRSQSTSTRDTVRQCLLHSEIYGNWSHSAASNTSNLRVVHEHQGEFLNMLLVCLQSISAMDRYAIKKIKIIPPKSPTGAMKKRAVVKTNQIQLLQENQIDHEQSDFTPEFSSLRCQL